MGNRRHGDNAATKTFVDLRKRPGTGWKTLHEEAEVTGFSGGGRGVSSRWGMRKNGRREYQGTDFSSQDERWTGNMNFPVELLDFVDEEIFNHRFNDAIDCGDNPDLFDFRVRQFCGDDPDDMTNYEMMHLFADAARTSKSFGNNLRASVQSGAEEKIMFNMAVSAGVYIPTRQLVNQDVKGSVTDVAINDIVHRGGDEYWACTDKDTAPGYAGNTAPYVLWTTDSGVTWNSLAIDDFLDGDAVAIELVNGKVVVASPDNGIAYARIDAIKDSAGSENIFTLATTTGVNDIAAVGNTVFGVADSGVIIKSTDGGRTFATVSSPTSANLNTVELSDKKTGWIGGASGTLLRLISSVPGTIASGVSDSIDCIAIPEGRSEDEMFFGTDAGEIYRCSSGALSLSNPTFTSMSFDNKGNGSIKDLKFSMYNGSFLFIIQARADGKCRILRDLSGGNLGDDVEIIGSFDKPNNAGVNAIAVRDVNAAFTVGEVVSSQGWIGQVSVI